MSKINMTPEEFAEKHARRLKAAVPDIQKGIMKVTESPAAKAAAKQDKMLANITESITSGKWKAGLGRVTLSSWQTNFVEKGVPRISQGIDSAKDKVVAFAGQLLAHEAALQSTINQMSDLTSTDAENRMLAWSRGMRKFVRK